MKSQMASIGGIVRTGVALTLLSSGWSDWEFEFVAIFSWPFLGRRVACCWIEYSACYIRCFPSLQQLTTASLQQLVSLLLV